MVNSERRRWFALALLSLVQFMVVLDLAIANVALPSIQADLGFSQEDLQWVISAYALVFGGFLLLGGRASDLLGRRRVLLSGIVVFSLASLFAGLAWSEATLIAARSVQGLGAAAITPAALSILSTTFAEGRERNVALGVWGAVGGVGAAAGLLLGGVLTDTAGWEWMFFLNVPVGAVAFVAGPRLLTESRDAHARSFDALGAVLVTGGLSSLVYAITQAEESGWLSAWTLSIFAVAVALLAGFVAWERRHPEPLMRLDLLRGQTLLGANVASLILNTTTLSTFLMLTLYMQQVLGFTPMQTGLAFLAIATTATVWSTVAAQLATRLGVRPVLLTGLTVLAGSLAYLSQISVGGSYVADLLPGFLLMALGLGFSSVPLSIAALGGVEPREAGLASGVLNTSQQIGGAIGIAVMSTFAATRTQDAVAAGATADEALVHGFRGALLLSATVALAGLAATLLLIRRRPAVPATEPQPLEPVEPTLELAA
jgi:EmrB/QacA subfamily drug resistance transporter